MIKLTNTAKMHENIFLDENTHVMIEKINFEKLNLQKNKKKTFYFWTKKSLEKISPSEFFRTERENFIIPFWALSRNISLNA